MFTLRDFLGNILVPITVISLISAFVIDYYLTKPAVDTGTAVSTATALSANSMVSDWQPFYEGGFGYDPVITTSKASIRVSTGIDGAWYGARGVIKEGAMDKGSLALAFRFTDWEASERIMILLSDSADFSSYYGINLKNYFAYPKNDEWREVVIDKSTFSVIEGHPQWDKVSHVAVRVVPKVGSATRVWFDDITFIPEEREQAVISLTFDDGFDSVVYAKDQMGQFNMKGTAFIIPELLNTKGYLTQAEVDSLASAGWDIAGHGPVNLATLSAVEVDANLALTRQYLEARNYQGREHYAYPNGSYNQSVQSQVHEYFTSARTIDGFVQPPERILAKNVNAITISKDTPVSEIVAQIDQAKQNKTWLILVWHDFTDDPALDYEYQKADFAWLLQYINSQDITVKPYSLAYQDYLKQNKP